MEKAVIDHRPVGYTSVGGGISLEPNAVMKLSVQNHRQTNLILRTETDAKERAQPRPYVVVVTTPPRFGLGRG